LAIAGSEAVLDLLAQGIVVEYADQSMSNSRLIGARITPSFKIGNQSGGVGIDTGLANLPVGFRLAPRLRYSEQIQLLDPDLFLDNIDDLSLGARTVRCVNEALQAFRGGLYLAAASLLGAASEGASYSAAELITDVYPQMGKHLSNRSTWKLQDQVFKWLTNQRSSAHMAPGLHAQAELLRQLRNYGVHPRTESEDNLEIHISESGAGALLSVAHSYLATFANAVAAAVEAARAEAPSDGL
jgi:hypothetical protein